MTVARRHSSPRRALFKLARIAILVPLAAFWATFSLGMLCAIVFAWYAAGALLVHLL